MRSLGRAPCRALRELRREPLAELRAEFSSNVVNGVLTATLVMTVLKIKIRQNADLVVNN